MLSAFSSSILIAIGTFELSLLKKPKEVQYLVLSWTLGPPSVQEWALFSWSKFEVVGSNETRFSRMTDSGSTN